MPKFASVVFTGSVEKSLAFLLAIAAVVLALTAAPGGLEWKIALSVIAILAFTTYAFGVRAYQFYNTYTRSISVIREVQGVGLSAHKRLLVLTNPGYLRDHDLLTLYSPTSGTDQVVAILQVTKSVPGEDVHAVAYPAGALITDLSSYFDAKNRTELYANPVVHLESLELALRQIPAADSFAAPSPQQGNS